METLLETVEVDAEKSNELFFKIRVEGLDQAPTKVRLVCEAGDISYMFKGYSTNEEGMIQFIIPPLKGQLREGVYQSRVEVLIENRYFSPLTFNLNFKKEMSVVVESVSVAKAAAPRVDVTPVPVVVKKAVSTPPAQVARSFVVEAEKRQQSKPVAVLKPVQVAHKVATLKERHVQQEPEIVDFDDVNEDLIRDITRSFARTVKK